MKSIISFEIEFSIKQDLLNLEDHDTCLLSHQKESRLIWKKERKEKKRKSIILVDFLKPYQIHLANPLELTQSSLAVVRSCNAAHPRREPRGGILETGPSPKQGLEIFLTIPVDRPAR